jgi:hypothetical protein
MVVTVDVGVGIGITIDERVGGEEIIGWGSWGRSWS